MKFHHLLRGAEDFPDGERSFTIVRSLLAEIPRPPISLFLG
jgi:hypothetical protein